MHDPTSIDRQGNDVGPQYRSAIFCLNENQRDLATAYKENIDLSAIWENPLVTQIEMLEVFIRLKITIITITTIILTKVTVGLLSVLN